MIPIKINGRILEKANNWSQFRGNECSIRQDGFNRLVGDTGEVVFSETYPDSLRISDKDHEADFVFNGSRVDVKTKDTTVNPKPHYEVTIPSYQKPFSVDYYFFYYFNRVTNYIWSLGWLQKDKFYEVARFMKKGEIEPYNQWKISQDCYIAKISDLKPPTK
jgi:hypothetical protein